ncbi:hypothetical protein [Streptomyces sp. NPDC003299]
MPLIERAINFAQCQSEDHYRAMLTNPEARARVGKAATIASDVQSRLYRAASSHRGRTNTGRQQVSSLKLRVHDGRHRR